jgi:hypothetical protein
MYTTYNTTNRPSSSDGRKTFPMLNHNAVNTLGWGGVGKIMLHAFLTLPLDGEAHSTESRHLYSYFEENSLDTAGNRTPVVQVSVLIYLASIN